jgi:hypothetical protein
MYASFCRGSTRHTHKERRQLHSQAARHGLQANVFAPASKPLTGSKIAAANLQMSLQVTAILLVRPDGPGARGCAPNLLGN